MFFYFMEPVLRLILMLWLGMVLCLLACSENTDAKLAFERGDYEASFQLWKPLAIDGDLDAQNYIAIHYYLGLGVKKDYREALKWFQKSAMKGHVDALKNYGMMHQNGYGIPVDYTEAYMWFYAAYRLGNKHVEKYMNDLASIKINPNQINAARKKANDFLMYAVDPTLLTRGT